MTCRDTARTFAPVLPAPRRQGAGPAHYLRLLIDAALAAVERARQRRQLRDLDDRLLRDVGLTRRDVEGECAKPFWRP